MLLQYYNYLRLGKSGYYDVQRASQKVALFLARRFRRWNRSNFCPMVRYSGFRLATEKGYTLNWNLYDLSRQLRVFGWQVPAYPLPPDLEAVTIMRVVVRNGFSMDLAHLFLRNLKQAVAFLDSLDGPMPHDTKCDNGFHH